MADRFTPWTGQLPQQQPPQAAAQPTAPASTGPRFTPWTGPAPAGSGGMAHPSGNDSTDPSRFIGLGLQGLGAGVGGLNIANQAGGNFLGMDLGPYGAGLGGLTSLYGLAQNARSGNPIGMAQNLYSAYSAANSLLDLGGPTVSSVLGIGGGGGGAGAAAGAGVGAGTAIGGMLGGAMLGAIPGQLIAGLADYFMAPDKSTGYWNNPIKGALSSRATAGVETANAILDRINTQGIASIPTDQLMRAMPQIVNSLAPYFATAQGGVGAIRASDTFTGGGGAEQYTANYTKAQSRMVDAVNELLKRGVSYEDLGKLPVTGNFVQQSMDMSNPLMDFYNRGNQGPNSYDAQASALLGALGHQEPVMAWESSGEGGQYLPTGAMQTMYNGQRINDVMTPQALLQAAQGAAPYSSAANSKASGLITDMYGGPLWTALARMGAGGQPMQDLIQQHFDPWVQARTWSPDVIGGLLGEQAAQQGLVEQQFLSGGP